MRQMRVRVWSLRSFAGKNPCKDDARQRASKGPHVIPWGGDGALNHRNCTGAERLVETLACLNAPCLKGLMVIPWITRYALCVRSLPKYKHPEPFKQRRAANTGE